MSLKLGQNSAVLEPCCTLPSMQPNRGGRDFVLKRTRVQADINSAFASSDVI